MYALLGLLAACLPSDDEAPGTTGADPVDTDVPCAELPWYPDVDGDGWGLEEGSVAACEAPDEHAARSGDCDDGDAAVSPEAEEACNGIDDDCDGRVDDEDGAVADGGTWYLDHDGDGYAGEAYTVTACEGPDGAAADPTDCDDGDAAVHPGAEETCDGLDNDCDGEIDTYDAGEPSWSGTFEANFSGGTMGYAFDVTCTGNLDLVVEDADAWSFEARMDEPCCEGSYGSCFELDFDGQLEGAGVEGVVSWSGGEDGTLAGTLTDRACGVDASLDATFSATLYPVGFWTYVWVGGTIALSAG